MKVQPIASLLSLAGFLALAPLGCGPTSPANPTDIPFVLRPGHFVRIDGYASKIQQADVVLSNSNQLQLVLPEYPTLAPLPLTREGMLNSWNYNAEECSIEIRVEAGTRILIVHKGDCSAEGITPDLGKYGLTGSFMLEMQ